MALDPTQIQAGTLRNRVTIQAPSATRDSFGQSGTSWTTVWICQAAIEDSASLTFRFSFQNNILASNATFCITIRYPGDSITIAPGMQVVYGDNTFTIQAVNDVLLRHRVIHLACVGESVQST
jgi:SPP1 family predicted phage head-tail adaptor